jgi:hypothetical protein
VHGPQHRRKLPRFFDFCAQAVDVDVDRSFVAVEIEAPHALEQPISRERNAGIICKLHQERELAWLELDVGSVDARLARGRIDLEPAEAQERSGLRDGATGAPQDRLDADDQLARGERFADIRKLEKA